MDSDRIYLDFNSTSPLAKSVQSTLAKGDLLAFNPSSLHSSGKAMGKSVREDSRSIQKIFNTQNELIFHSGASEALSFFVQGMALKATQNQEKLHFFYSNTDHSCVTNQVKILEILGHDSSEIAVDQNGQLDKAQLHDELKRSNAHVKLLNLTWVNNETGVIQDLTGIESIVKEFQNLFIHLDSVQSVGKVSDWQKIPDFVHMASYSAHKFGGLKSVGFSFIDKALNPIALIRGGEQQRGVRSGTVNALGIKTTVLALQEVLKCFDDKAMYTFRKKFEDVLVKNFDKKIRIIAQNSPRATNTISLYVAGSKAELTMAAFDMNGIDISIGSACSSGSLKPSRVLCAMGLEDISREVVRISWGFTPLTEQDLERVIQTLHNICHE